MTIVSAFLTILLTLFVGISLLILALALRVSRAFPAPLLSWQSRYTLHYIALPMAGVSGGLALTVLALEFGYPMHALSGLAFAGGALCWTATLTLMHRVRVYEEGMVLHGWNPTGFLPWKYVYDYMKTTRGATRFTFFSGRIPQRKRVDVLVPTRAVRDFEHLLEHVLDARYDVALALRLTRSVKQQSR